MELLKNQVVVFADGHIEGWLEARWSERAQAFYSFNEAGEKVFSTMVVDKQKRKQRQFIPTADNCKIRIEPCGESEKAYQIYDGSNGHVGRTCKSHYKYIAKSICYIDENGNVFAPVWA